MVKINEEAVGNTYKVRVLQAFLLLPDGSPFAEIALGRMIDQVVVHDLDIVELVQPDPPDPSGSIQHDLLFLHAAPAVQGFLELDRKIDVLHRLYKKVHGPDLIALNGQIGQIG